MSTLDKNSFQYIYQTAIAYAQATGQKAPAYYTGADTEEMSNALQAFYAQIPQAFKDRAAQFPGGDNDDFQSYMMGLVPVKSEQGSDVWVTPQEAQERQAEGASIASGYSATGSSAANVSAAQLQTDAEFQKYLSTLDLTADQKKALEAIYGAVSVGDQEKANQLKAAMQAATQYSDPYFKAQTRLALDAMDRAFNATDGDLAYNETKLRTSLEDLKNDLAAAKDYLSFQEVQELQDLERHYTADLDQTQQDMAARGFSSSSIRTRKEQLINDTYGDLRESSNRAFLFKTGQLTDQEARADRDIAAEIARLQELSAQGKLDTYRQTEATVGSTALPGETGLTPLGGIGGTIPRQQTQDAISFASNFVF
jgi:hypothetical protein